MMAFRTTKYVLDSILKGESIIGPSDFLIFSQPFLSLSAWLILTFLLKENLNGGGVVSANYFDTLQVVYLISGLISAILVAISFKYHLTKWALHFLNAVVIFGLLFLSYQYKSFRLLNISFLALALISNGYLVWLKLFSA